MTEQERSDKDTENRPAIPAGLRFGLRAEDDGTALEGEPAPGREFILVLRGGITEITQQQFALAMGWDVTASSEFYVPVEKRAKMLRDRVEAVALLLKPVGIELTDMVMQVKP